MGQKQKSAKTFYSYLRKRPLSKSAPNAIFRPGNLAPGPLKGVYNNSTATYDATEFRYVV